MNYYIERRISFYDPLTSTGSHTIDYVALIGDTTLEETIKSQRTNVTAVPELRYALFNTKQNMQTVLYGLFKGFTDKVISPTLADEVDLASFFAAHGLTFYKVYGIPINDVYYAEGLNATRDKIRVTSARNIVYTFEIKELTRKQELELLL